VHDKRHRFFPPFRLDPANAQFWRNHEKVNLRPKTFEVLLYLVDRPGRLVTKAALLDAIWPEVSVSDSMPATCVKELRRALGDEAHAPRFIETVHRRGYRFVAQVTTGAKAEETVAPKSSSEILVGREQELAELLNLYYHRCSTAIDA
jgi:DNA-binding winged helix-turn-helix (wHTH) protein